MYTIRINDKDTQVPDLPTLAAMVKRGEVTQDTAVYDHDTGAWTTVGAVTAPPSLGPDGGGQPIGPPTEATGEVLEKPEGSAFDVVMEDAGKDKVAVVKEVRADTGLGLKEAKELVDAAPATIAEAVSIADAERIRGTLEGLGARVSVTGHGKPSAGVPKAPTGAATGPFPDGDVQRLAPPSPPPPAGKPPTGGSTVLAVGAWIVFGLCGLLLIGFLIDMFVLSALFLVVAMAAICPPVVKAVRNKSSKYSSRGIRFTVFFISLILALSTIPTGEEKSTVDTLKAPATKSSKNVKSVKQVAPKPVDLTRRFAGQMGMAYSIAMELTVNEADGTVHGTYRYANKQETIPLEGKHEAGNTVVTEQVDGKTTGTFTGAITADGFSGTWKSGDGKVSLPFKVTRSGKVDAEPLKPFLDALRCRETPSWNASYRVKEDSTGVTIDCFYGPIWSDDYRDEGAAMEAHKLAGYYALSFKPFTGREALPKRYRVRYYAEAAKDKYGNPKPPVDLVTFSGNPARVQKELAKYKSDEALTNRVFDFFEATGISASATGRYEMVLSAARIWEVTQGY